MKAQRLYDVEIYESSASGQRRSKRQPSSCKIDAVELNLNSEQHFQQILGFGGAFTKASATLLAQLSLEKQNEILEGYFGKSGARYSLTRTHINSCDFSPYPYAYANVPNDFDLCFFDIKEDLLDLVPMIHKAQRFSKNGFKCIASPWSAPPWMKDNQDWKGGKLLPEYYATWALYFSKYIEAYKKEGIDIWGITVENEPLGNGENWESMHFTPEEMNRFVRDYLSPMLKQKGQKVRILGYDQNRDEAMISWASAMYNPEMIDDYDGIGIHWYASTTSHFPEALDALYQLAPDKYIIQTEACVDAQIPEWQNDKWYWQKVATDWGWNWAPAAQKHLHPKYVPVFRYANDIIGCLNHWVNGWIDWNMVLDRQGGPNWAKNWCTAPVIVDLENDEVYVTPLYDVMWHFSRFIRPGAVRIGFEMKDDVPIKTTAIKNQEGSIVCVLLNESNQYFHININLDQKRTATQLHPKSLQTVIFSPPV